MMYILLLLAQEMRTHRIQRITPQLVIPLHNLQHIQLQSPIDLCLPGIALSKRLGRKRRVLHTRLVPCDSSQEGEFVVEVARFGAVNEIWQVEVRDVVPDHDVWVDLLEEVFPGHEQGFLGSMFEDLGSYYLRTSVDCKNIPDKRF
jgi:hypothetical protein